MFHKVKKVQALNSHILLVIFEDRSKRKYDIKQLSDKREEFKKLTNNFELFKNVKVDIGGYGIFWNEDIDLSCEELWSNGIEE